MAGDRSDVAVDNIHMVSGPAFILVPHNLRSDHVCLQRGLYLDAIGNTA